LGHPGQEKRVEAAAEPLHWTFPHPRPGRRQTGVGNGRERDVADVSQLRWIKERVDPKADNGLRDFCISGGVRRWT